MIQEFILQCKSPKTPSFDKETFTKTFDSNPNPDIEVSTPDNFGQLPTKTTFIPVSQSNSRIFPVLLTLALILSLIGLLFILYYFIQN